MKLASSLLTYGNLAVLFAGGLLHKAGSYFYAKYAAAKSDVEKAAKAVENKL